jgi:1-acyl-sn-glycerol-3-phosphate acyltransferase
MRHKKNDYIPGSIFYFLCIFLVNLVIRTLFHFKKPKKPEGMGENFIVLGNHASKFDYLFLAVSLYPKRLRFIVTEYYTHNKILNKILKTLKCIPKYQFQSDPVAIKAMIKTVKNGGSLAMYPQGQIPYDGCSGQLPEGLGKLLKILNCDVLFFRLDGSHFLSPKWAKKLRRGKVDIMLKRIITKEALRLLNEKEVELIVRDHLTYNDYEWEKTAKREFKGKKRAESLEQVLYLCPICGSEFSIISHNHKFHCEKCKCWGKINTYGSIESSMFTLNNPNEWINYEHEQLALVVSRDEFEIACSSKFRTRTKDHVYSISSNGKLSLTERGLSFVSYDKTVSIDFKIDKLNLMAHNIGVDFEIGQDNKVYIFTPYDGRQVIKFLIASEELYRLKTEETTIMEVV